MNHQMNIGRVFKLAAATALAVSLAACQPMQDRLNGGGSGTWAGDKGNNAVGDIDPGKRKLTVVGGPEKKQTEAVSVEKIHRLAGAAIEAWLTDDMLRVMTTEQIKPATATEEAKYDYTISTIDLAAGDRKTAASGNEKVDLTVVKEQVSPDGKFSFIQKWTDKYSAKNYVKNLDTGTQTEVKVTNYMEVGGWLDGGSYILAAGSQSGRGDIWQIGTDGAVKKVDFKDPDVEFFNEFGVSQGSIYYVDKQSILKRLSPGQEPEVVSKQVLKFEISPDGKHIAVETFQADRRSSEIHLMGEDGKLEGGALAKGNLFGYLSWSPDSSKLALSVYNEDKNGLNGVYIFDYVSGQLSLVGPGYFPEYPLSWSPTGKRLGVTISGENSLPVTQILDFNL